ncbi:DNA polymerase family A [Desulfatibacillum alkenivorans DSM 16219]|uniref:DNA-directed DNA polymerase n=1 Tax=Desulfatibacillum alkenivorans DSM 16219 TaxID=1121393 RepID=A0A1M6UEB3_9BACT|nr:DNA polymerase [Desulfatibacillum alkenivorans]SHK67526.1 DNA polymerase family A [Desulfatibacillum alkenivorans DSM 16219]
MNKTEITYAASKEDIPKTSPVNDYLTELQNNQDRIFSGEMEIFIAPKFRVEDEDFFFPIFEISVELEPVYGDESNEFQRAMYCASRTLDILKNLEVDGYFKVIAKENGAIRLASRLAIPIEFQGAFAHFVLKELPIEYGLEFIEPTDSPEPLLTNGFHNDPSSLGGLLSFHSEIMDGCWRDLSMAEFTALIQGNPDPESYIAFVAWLTCFQALNPDESDSKFAQELSKYKVLLDGDTILPFNPQQIKKPPKALSLDAVQTHLTSKGIRSKVEKRGESLAISFDKLPCPMCGRTDTRAWAYPPFYRLKCFNARCEASYEGEGVPLITWAGLVNEYQDRQDSISQTCYFAPPESYMNCDQARAIVPQTLSTALETGESALLLVTPGVGKSHGALEYLASHCTGKTIIYSCLNKALKNEAYQKCLDFASDKSKIHNLEARDALCSMKDEHKRVVELGYSPGKIMCANCSHKSTCPYQLQRQNIGPGIHFVTHAMLRYLEEYIPGPDLIVLDENLLQGFVTDEFATEADMRTLMKVFHGQEKVFVENIIAIGSHFATQTAASSSGQMAIINSHRLSEYYSSEDTFLDYFGRKYEWTPDQIDEAIDLSWTVFADRDEKALHDESLNYKAAKWIRGLTRQEPHQFSYIQATPAGEVRFRTKEIVKLGFGLAPVVILDATGDPKLAKALTGKSHTVHRADVRWEGRGIHIKQKLSKSNLAKKSDSDLKNILRKAIENISAEKILILSHQRIKGASFKSKILGMANSLSPEKEFAFHHFYGPRGINDYADYEAVIVLGLPIPNISMKWQEALILFPEEADEAIRNSWVELNTNWELTQCFHRIRPIYQEQTEFVFAGDPWPNWLPSPTKVIDESRDTNKVDKAFNILKPIVQAFGFVNRDAAFLAGVLQKRHENLFEQFKSDFYKMDDWLTASNLHEQLRYAKNNRTCISCLGNQQFGNSAKLSATKLLLYNIAKLQIDYDISQYNLTENFCHETLKISLYHVAKLMDNETVYVSEKQFKKVMQKIKAWNPELQDFKVKSGYGKGHDIKGIGLRDQVREFYGALNASDLFPNTNLNSIEFNEQPSGEPLPDGVIVVELNRTSYDSVTVWEKDRTKTMSLKDCVKKIGNLPSSGGSDQDAPKVVTNDGKRLAKEMLDQNVSASIHDVFLSERILKNGRASSRHITEGGLFQRYELQSDMVRSWSGLQQIAVSQLQSIEKQELGWVLGVETEMMRIAAKMERNGILVDKAHLESLEKDHPQFVDKALNRIQPDGRFYDEIDQLGEVSARMVSKLDGIPRDEALRSCFIPAPGNKFIIADYKQQESRILAGLSGDEHMLAVFESGTDFYEYVGEMFEAETGVAFDRKHMKQVVNAINYWASAEKVHQILKDKGYVIQECDIISAVGKYRQEFSKLFAWRDEAVRQAKKDGIVKTANGRRQYIDESIKTAKISNYVVQGTAADGFKHALTMLDSELDGTNARIAHTMRDGLIVEAEAESAPQVERLVQAIMENAFDGMVQGVKFPVDIYIADSWG